MSRVGNPGEVRDPAEDPIELRDGSEKSTRVDFWIEREVAPTLRLRCHLGSARVDADAERGVSRGTGVPAHGQLVSVRRRQFVVLDVERSVLPPDALRPNGRESSHLVKLASVEEDAADRRVGGYADSRD